MNTDISSKSLSKNGFEEAERTLILSVLEKNNNNKIKSAKELKIHPSTLWRKMKKFGLLDNDK